MNRHRHPILAVLSLGLGVLFPVRGLAAALTQVNRSDWVGSVSLPSYLQMYVYVPAKIAATPPIVVSAHSCGSSATGQVGNIPETLATADSQGFVVILPDNPGQNCWDVGSTQALTHDGGSDTYGVALMVKYALTKYNGDPNRVYIFGGSSGAMLTQAMCAVYPDVFRACSARAGVPAGCWAVGYASSNQWSNSCANGQVDKTAQQWGDEVRMMYPGYSGHRPRMQLFQGEADTTISYNNTGESIKEWTNVLNLSTNPTSSDTGYKAANATYDRKFWSNGCGYTVLQAWSSPGGTHSMPYEEAEILKFFGLDVATTSDPEPDCSGSTGAGGAAGGSNGAAGGSSGAAGAGGHPGSGGGPGGAGGNAGSSATGGAFASGGTGGSSSTTGTGGLTGSGGGSGGVPGTGGITALGGAQGTGGTTSPRGGNGGSSSEGSGSSGGCTCAATSPGGTSSSGLATLVIAGLVLGRRIRRTRRRHQQTHGPTGGEKSSSI